MNEPIIDFNIVYQNALALQKEMEFKDALEKYEDCLESFNHIQDPDLLFNIGLCYYKLNNLEQAFVFLIESKEILLKLDSDSIKLINNIKKEINPSFSIRIQDYIKFNYTKINILKNKLQKINNSYKLQFNRNKLIKKIYNMIIRFRKKLKDFVSDEQYRKYMEKIEPSSDIQKIKPIAILDTNFFRYFIEDKNSNKLLKFLSKASKVNILLTTTLIIEELYHYLKNKIDETFKLYELYNYLSKYVKIIDIEFNIIKFEDWILNKWNNINEIRNNHSSRMAWVNDLSLILLYQLSNYNEKFLITNDSGIISIIKCLNGENSYYSKNIKDTIEVFYIKKYENYKNYIINSLKND